MLNLLHTLFSKVAVLTTVAAIALTAPFHHAQPTLSPTPSPIVSSSPSASTNIPSSSGSFSSGCHSLNGLPDPNCTPGVADPRVTQDNIYQTICVSGYTKTVRPSVSYTNKLKVEQIKEYGYSDTNTRDYEEDHLIPLEVGGSPTDPKNLWAESGSSPNPKDKIENLCHKLVCSYQISLSEAQKEIATNWYTACGNSSSTNQITQPTQNQTVQPIIVPVPITNSGTLLIPAGVTGICNDGTYTSAQTHRGACSHHGGVPQWP